MPGINDPWVSNSAVSPVVIWKVFRLPDPDDEDDDDEPTEMTNLECMEITRGIGGDPGLAHFRMILGNQAPPNAPTTFEQAVSAAVSLPLSVNVNDRLVVRAYYPIPSSGVAPTPAWSNIFDGHVLVFALNVDSDTEEVELLATGMGRKLHNTPIPGAIYRQGGSPLINTHSNDVATKLRAHFNPKGHPNRIPDVDSEDYFSNKDSDQRSYPVFLDENLSYGTSDIRNPVAWTLPDACRYLLYTGNNEVFVYNPNAPDLASLLVSYEPSGTGAVDVNNPSTYTKTPIVLGDKPVDSHDLVGTVTALVSDKGFNTRFRLETNSDGSPTTRFEIYLPAREPVVDVYLQPRGSTLDANLSNFAKGNISRDMTQAINQWVVEGQRVQYEVSLILACGFPVVAGDASTPTVFNTSDPTYTTTNYNKYRYFIADECGLGHYANTPGAAADNTIFDFDTVFGPPISGKPQWVQKLRKPLGNLLTNDSHGKPLKARLDYTTNTVTAASVWSGDSNVWQNIKEGWELLPDRIGVRVTVQNPNAWNLGRLNGSVQPVILKLVESLATPNDVNKTVYFRLTCVIEADAVVQGSAIPAPNSALNETVKRIVDARDRYKKTIILAKSLNNNTTSNVLVRDDTSNAFSEASAMQLATAGGILGGSIRIPYFTTIYKRGQQIGSINGRGLSFRTDGGEDGTPPTYPRVESITWSRRGGRDETLIHVSDASSARKGYRGSRSQKAKRHG